MRRSLEVRNVRLCLVLPWILSAGACRDDDGGGPEACDLANPSCPEGTVCLADPDGGGGGTCQDTCDPADPEACAEGTVCEALSGGEHACFAPVHLDGRVFDLATDAGIEGALVTAADATGAVVTDVVTTDVDGRYSLAVPVERDTSGVPQGGVFTLRVSASGYQPYPSGLRPSIPVDVGEAMQLEDGDYSVSNPTTDVGLIALAEDAQGLGSISGTVRAEGAAGTLVVATCPAPPCPFAYADKSGAYSIFNVPAGSYTVTGYHAGLSLEPVDVMLADGEQRDGVDLAASEAAVGTVSGSVNIVNPGDGQATSVVLIPEAAFQQITDTFVRGEVVPGLRAPEPGLPPNVTGAFTIDGVPAGDYVVLAGFENDFLVRDPDPGIAGTQIVHITVDAGATVDLTDSFKITGALTMVGPGADGPEPVDPSNLVFSWADDSSEDYYTLAFYDAFGNEVWSVPDVPAVMGSATVDVAYEGPALEPGMYYQWRAESWRNSGPISTTEDLLGVFFVPAAGGP